MIQYVKRIEDFWSSSLENFVFPVRSNLYQRDYFHKNYDKEYDLFQAFDNELPNGSEKFYESLGITEGSISWTCLEPGQVIPIHTDSFYKLRQKFSVDVDNCVRYLIMLQDWTLGHYVEFEEQLITKWSKGDVFVFDHTSRHCAANTSNVNFVTCQVNTIVNR